MGLDRYLVPRYESHCSAVLIRQPATCCDSGFDVRDACGITNVIYSGISAFICTGITILTGSKDFGQLVVQPLVRQRTDRYNYCVDSIKYTIHDDYAIMTMVEAGLGISILTELVLQRTNYDIELRETNPPIKRSIAFVYRSQASLPLAAKQFMEYLFSRKDELV